MVPGRRIGILAVVLPRAIAAMALDRRLFIHRSSLSLAQIFSHCDDTFSTRDIKGKVKAAVARKTSLESRAQRESKEQESRKPEKQAIIWHSPSISNLRSVIETATHRSRL
jgi:hypothetical protein